MNPSSVRVSYGKSVTDQRRRNVGLSSTMRWTWKHKEEVEWEWGYEGGWEWVLEGGGDHEGGWDHESDGLREAVAVIVRVDEIG